MSDTLVKQLRSVLTYRDLYLCIKAADRIEELEAKLAKAVEAARELMDAFYINGNVTERHYRACQAGVKLETTLAELKGESHE